MQNVLKNKKGAAALITVVVISAAAMIMARSITFLVLSELDIEQSLDKGAEAFFISEGCIEETLRRIRLDTSYLATNEVLTYGNGSCIINVTSSGSERVATAKGSLNNYYKNLKAHINLMDNEIELLSWEVIKN